MLITEYSFSFGKGGDSVNVWSNLEFSFILRKIWLKSWHDDVKQCQKSWLNSFSIEQMIATISMWLNRLNRDIRHSIWSVDFERRWLESIAMITTLVIPTAGLQSKKCLVCFRQWCDWFFSRKFNWDFERNGVKKTGDTKGPPDTKKPSMDNPDIFTRNRFDCMNLTAVIHEALFCDFRSIFFINERVTFKLSRHIYALSSTNDPNIAKFV